MNKSSVAVAAFLFLAGTGCGMKHEHAGKSAEHGSSTATAAAEHAGGKAEHGGKKAEHGGTKVFNAEQVKTAMTAHILQESAKNGGVLMIKDEKTAETLSLEFVKIHDPVRIIEGKGYFACTDFRPKGAAADKLYDLDFWLKPDGGKLTVYDTKIHKHPEAGKDGTWTKKERYTFIDDNPVEVK